MKLHNHDAPCTSLLSPSLRRVWVEILYLGIVKICGVEKSPKIEKAEAFASVFRSEGRSPERRETDAARVAARRTQCVAGQAMVIMFAFAHSLYGTGGIPPGLNDVILILL